LRNPWRFHIDRESGLAYITDVGHLRREEINIVPWNSPGTNFGWADLEGSLCTWNEACSAEGITLPALEYGHDKGCAIIGGVVYRGQMFPEFVGHYFYADLCGGVRSFRYEGGEITLERQWWGDELGQIIAIADGPGGELWLTTLEGLVYRFDPRPEDAGF
jgi:glucose/arabinose dehydrogenase